MSFGQGNPYGDPNWYDRAYHSAYYKECWGSLGFYSSGQDTGELVLNC